MLDQCSGGFLSLILHDQYWLLRWRVLVPKIQINRVKWPFKIISDMELLSSGICLPIILLLLPVKECFVKLTKCLTFIYLQEPGSTENNRTKLITSSAVTSPFSKMWQRGWRILVTWSIPGAQMDGPNIPQEHIGQK